MPWREQDRNPAYDRGWKPARLACLRRAGWRCQIRAPGCTSKAVTVDHVLGIKADPEHRHLQAACQRCHDEKTKGEAARGRRRRPPGDPECTPRTNWD